MKRPYPRCRIAEMLKTQKRHMSFHTPGHKRVGGGFAGSDITELPYSDSLLSPHGVIARAEEDVAEILGARKSFILTDGATCGVHAMLRCLKAAGAESVAFSVFSHKSVKEGCALAGLEAVEIDGAARGGVPLQPTEEQIARALLQADALLLTSPDYYGNFPPLTYTRALCDRVGKPLLIDGAHGAHLHYSANYAGRYADLWTDGAHKSLPALTQGAVVSAKDEPYADLLGEAVNIFRTTSPSYPIMASVEYAVKYPRNEEIEKLSERVKREIGAYPNADWSKIAVPFGSFADEAQKTLEKKGIFCEFNDGNYLMFYLSPCTKAGDLKKLGRILKGLPRGEAPAEIETGARVSVNGGTRRIPLREAAGRICAQECGLFPPCVPLVLAGTRVTEEQISRLLHAENTFGLQDGGILVYDGEEENG